MEFKKVVRGYDPDEVDEAFSKLEAKNKFLDTFQQTAEAEIERLKKRLADDLEELNTYRNESRKLRDAFAGVQRVETLIREDAERGVSALMDNARIEAKDIIDKAQKEAEAKLNEAEAKLKESSEILMITTAEANEVVEKRKGEISEELQVLESELVLKQESLNKLITLEEGYRQRSTELREHIEAIVNLFSV